MSRRNSSSENDAFQTQVCHHGYTVGTRNYLERNPVNFAGITHRESRSPSSTCRVEAGEWPDFSRGVGRMAVVGAFEGT